MTKKNDAIKTASNCMPTDAVSLKILHERAESLAENIINIKKTDQEVNYIKFRLGKSEYYGIPYKYIREVVQDASITPVLSKNKCLVGAINIRSGLIGVIDIQNLINIKTDDSEDKKYIIIVSDGIFIFGIIANELMGSGVYDATKIQKNIYEGLVNMDFVIGLDEDNSTIIDIKNICKHLQSIKG